MKRLLVGLVALAICVGVFFLIGRQMSDTALRNAESAVAVCYSNEGYALGSGRDIPDDIRTRCTQPIRGYEDGRTMRLIYAGLAGLAGAGIILLLAWLLMFRRREPVG